MKDFERVHVHLPTLSENSPQDEEARRLEETINAALRRATLVRQAGNDPLDAHWKLAQRTMPRDEAIEEFFREMQNDPDCVHVGACRTFPDDVEPGLHAEQMHEVWAVAIMRPADERPHCYVLCSGHPPNEYSYIWTRHDLSATRKRK